MPIRKTEAIIKRRNIVAVGERYSKTILTPIKEKPQKIIARTNTGYVYALILFAKEINIQRAKITNNGKQRIR
jgi:hypothetical protein